ncbi:uncharacterized protein BT62DRAFT_445001 [Guyanagaster necrorhizus]|uniref:Uncharacterized protein n=1 Tax=Guyanagaster necrorhizus TaxID=856835 RepID=A0A9P7VKV3_9AGAR|nr:uncharacterized protein BT62DRAFT_445001 [Guyanagaster necrorhizus MCA 3950]KAG7442347.1 hypothetical protein BT62DRAFT_445001 [Guyanagaster necrorhizus MCA 3950]
MKAVHFTSDSLHSHTGKIWSVRLTFRNVTYLQLLRVECTETQYCGLIQSLPKLEAITVSEISIPNYLERIEEIASLSSQNTPEEVRKGQTGPALHTLSVGLKNFCDGILLSLFASRRSVARMGALKQIYACAPTNEPFFCGASVVIALSVFLELASRHGVRLHVGNLLPVRGIALPPLRIPVNMPLLSIICNMVLTDNYKTANSIEWFISTFNNVSHPTDIESVRINVSLAITILPWDRLPQRGGDAASISQWGALDEALCRPEVRLEGLLIHVQPAGPLWMKLIDSVARWLSEVCLPKAREKYPSATPGSTVVGHNSIEEPFKRWRKD